MTIFSARAFRTLSLLSTLSLVAIGGCGSLKTKGADEGDAAAAAAVAEAVDAAPHPAAAPIAANVDAVARFADEKPLENVAAILQRTTNVREIPSVGKVVATLARGATVTEVAQRGTAFLVVFDDPKDQKKVMGWVGQESFTAGPAVAAGIKAPTCRAPEVPLLSDGPFCGRVCTSDAACPAGQACKGVANKLTNAKVGDAVTLCTAFTQVVRPVAPVGANAGRPPVTPAAAANASRAPVTPVVPPSPPAPLGGGGSPPVATGGSAPASAPTSGLPPCPDDPPMKMPGEGDAPSKPAPCIKLPKTGRANGVACSKKLHCLSNLCSGAVCKGCASDADCAGGTQRAGTVVVCASGGLCRARQVCKDDDGFCSHDGDCCSGKCRERPTLGGKHTARLCVP